jgi:DNA-binding NarL/FixJ family response regulator
VTSAVLDQQMATGSTNQDEGVYRVLIVDDRPDLRAVLRARLGFESDIEVIGEASNGEEAVRMTKALAPSAVLLDLEMPVMRGDEAIPLLRAAAPGMSILLYTGFAGDAHTLEEQRPDAIVRKGLPLSEVVHQLRVLLERVPFDVVRIEIGTLPLRQATAAFDTWAGLAARILETLGRGDDLAGDQLSGATPEQMEALMGIYAHIGNNLQKAARAGLADVTPVIHTFRATGFMARSALLAFDDDRLAAVGEAWGYDVPPEAVTALSLMRERLTEALPASAGTPPISD